MSEKGKQDLDMKEWANACAKREAAAKEQKANLDEMAKALGAQGQAQTGGIFGGAGQNSQYADWTKKSSASDCPHCGKCKECGRGGDNYQTWPHYNRPYNPWVTPYRYEYQPSWTYTNVQSSDTAWQHSDGSTTYGPR